jgi:drug/metabolite transporter (DMT)-like permease
MTMQAQTWSRGYWSGVALVVLSDIALSIAPSGAKLAYDGGSNTLTVVALRGVIAMILLAICAFALRLPFKASAGAFCWSVLAGLFYSIMLYGYLGSVEYIPVSLAILIYFIHPILIVILAAFKGDGSFGWQKIGLSVVVFLGLGIAIGPELQTLDGRGIALALLAAAGVCGMILFNARAQAGMSNVLTNFYMTAVTGGVFTLITTMSGGWAIPQTSSGWVGVALTGIGMVVGLLAFFAAFKYIGPVRATMISNVEPLIGILFAVLLLGESLALQQWIGALLVVGGLICFELPKSRQQALPATPV